MHVFKEKDGTFSFYGFAREGPPNTPYRCGDTFIEIDTGRQYKFNGVVWVGDFSSTPTVRRETKKASPSDRCLACGKELRIRVDGRRKYCDYCGCYLPEVSYNKDCKAIAAN